MSEFATGFYGKLPSNGDFVRRDLPNDFVTQWDNWLQECLASSKRQLGEVWTDTYLTSPVWRFVISPGIQGDACWLGCISPSTDEVGRFFPLTVAHPLPADTNPYLLAMLSNSWCQHIESSMLSLFNEGVADAEQFHHQVNQPELPVIPDFNNRSQGVGYGEAWHFQGFEYPDGYFSGLIADQLLNHHLGAYSLWWGAGSQAVAPSVAITRSIPDPSQFAAMLSGDWQGAGWFSTDRNTV